jgi:DNA-binding transcriptional LysR family regulator
VRAGACASLNFRLWEPGYYRLLSDEGVDLVATIADLLPENLHGRAMGEDRAVCLMRASHPLAQQPLTLDDYVHATHLRISGGSDRDGVIEQALARLGLRRDVRLTVPFFGGATRRLQPGSAADGAGAHGDPVCRSHTAGLEAAAV